ncbi:hypothetical protein [Rugosimonospora africana]|uniref:Uncharacterized protein n=1 Tax=Rugosimonospora africana TaxID=556532 RepID=A0A8J3QXZ5_9ACTN|nr:hypothetical protein [Rugosimonospora africana]GIH16731.1 hypothetical protein Raf01_49030 [Rugosimonospora africana]
MDFRRTTLAAVVVLALSGCSVSGRPSASTPSEGGGTAAHGSALSSALDQVPDIGDGSVFYADWSMLGDQNTTSFAGGLVAVDDQMQRDLGIRSRDARWELDVQRVHLPPVEVLSYDVRTDLSGLATKLTRLSYRADGSILIGPTGQVSQEHTWMFPLRAIGIDRKRHLLVGSSDAVAVRSLMAVPSHPLGHAESVVPLLAQVAARQDRTATAAIAVGSAACMPLTSMIGKSVNPEQLAAVRRQFPGTFTPPQAEITAIAGPTDTTALDALTFPDHRSAQANQAARSAASQTLSGIEGDANEVRATGTAVTGRVLSFDLTANQPQAVVQRVMGSKLGVDLCP